MLESIGVALLAVLGLGACGYLAGCAAAQRWLTFREWWGDA